MKNQKKMNIFLLKVTYRKNSDQIHEQMSQETFWETTRHDKPNNQGMNLKRVSINWPIIRFMEKHFKMLEINVN